MLSIPPSINDSSLAVRSKVMSFPRKTTTQLTTEQGESTRVWQLQWQHRMLLWTIVTAELPTDLVKALCSKYSCPNYFMPNPASPFSIHRTREVPSSSFLAQFFHLTLWPRIDLTHLCCFLFVNPIGMSAPHGQRLLSLLFAAGSPMTRTSRASNR